MNKIALVSALALLALAAEPAAADRVGATGDVAFFFCPTSDTVKFVAVDNDDGTWTFAIVDIGDPCSPFADGGVGTGTGSPETGFTGDLSSGPWTISGNSFTATLSFAVALQVTLSGVATGEFVNA